MLSVKNGPRLTGPTIEIRFLDNFQYQPDVLTCSLFLFPFFEQVRWTRRHIPHRSTWATSSRRILTPMAPEDPFPCLWWVFIILLFPVSFYLSEENSSRTCRRRFVSKLSPLFPPFLSTQPTELTSFSKIFRLILFYFITQDRRDFANFTFFCLPRVPYSIFYKWSL